MLELQNVAEVVIRVILIPVQGLLIFFIDKVQSQMLVVSQLYNGVVFAHAGSGESGKQVDYLSSQH